MFIMEVWKTLFYLLWTLSSSEAPDPTILSHLTPSTPSLSVAIHSSLAVYDDVSRRIVIMGREGIQTIDPYSFSQETHVLNTSLSNSISPSQSFVKNSIFHWKVGYRLKRFNMSKSQQMKDLVFPKDHMGGISCIAFNRKF